MNLISAQLGACMHSLVSIHTWGSLSSSDAGNHCVAVVVVVVVVAVEFYELGNNLLDVCAVALPPLVAAFLPFLMVVWHHSYFRITATVLEVAKLCFL